MSHPKTRGFTLIELVVTTVLIAILAVTVAPRFFASSEFQTQLNADALVAQLRALQQSRLAGQQCQLQVTDQQFKLAGQCQQLGTQPCLDGSDQHCRFAAQPLGDAPLKHGNRSQFTVSLDDLGRPAFDNCLQGCRLVIAGIPPISVQIEAEGYIHALP